MREGRRTEKATYHSYKAVTGSGAPIITVGGHNHDEARERVKEQLEGRPGGRHGMYLRWLDGGAQLRYINDS